MSRGLAVGTVMSAGLSSGGASSDVSDRCRTPPANAFAGATVPVSVRWPALYSEIYVYSSDSAGAGSSVAGSPRAASGS